MLISAVFIFTPSMEVSAVTETSNSLYFDATGSKKFEVGTADGGPVSIGDYSGTATYASNTLTLTDFVLNSTATTVITLPAEIQTIVIKGACRITSKTDDSAVLLIDSKLSTGTLTITANTANDSLVLDNRTEASSNAKAEILKTSGASLDMIGSIVAKAGDTSNVADYTMFTVGTTFTFTSGNLALHLEEASTGGNSEIANVALTIGSTADGFFRTTPVTSPATTALDWTKFDNDDGSIDDLLTLPATTLNSIEISNLIANGIGETGGASTVEVNFVKAPVEYVIQIPAVIAVDSYDTSSYAGEIELVSSNIRTTRTDRQLIVTVKDSTFEMTNSLVGTDKIAFEVHRGIDATPATKINPDRDGLVITLDGTPATLTDTDDIATFDPDNDDPVTFSVNVPQTEWNTAAQKSTGKYQGTIDFTVYVADYTA
jgi:hypothetical protein